MPDILWSFFCIALYILCSIGIATTGYMAGDRKGGFFSLLILWPAFGIILGACLLFGITKAFFLNGTEGVKEFIED